MSGTRILTVNAGSTSVRLGCFAPGPDGARKLRVAKRECTPGEESAALEDFLVAGDGAPVSLVVHRVVHAGPRFRSTHPFDAEVEGAVSAMSALAPLHNPPTLRWRRVCGERWPAAPQLAVFDSGFFSTLPDVAATYALPTDVAATHGIRRLGFHGLAHRSMWEAFRRLRPEAAGRVISFQLGGGCSVAALRDGVPVDTSMGFSPLEGLVMSSRPGDLDVGVLLYLLQATDSSAAELDAMLNQRSGLMGISGLAGGVRTLLEADTTAARLALDVYCYRARKYLGAYMVALGGCDAVLVGGGAGEGSARLRERLFADLPTVGIAFDAEANATARAPARIDNGARPEVWVVPTDEESVLADEAVTWMHTQTAETAR